ncbi:MAG: hypothetical protein QF435_14520 [Arenicellales bacterium]|jgi:hypothetical protein|nr:hypothetical protein [Arenicellales bacterium]|tara:strand:+ start:5547 stop:5882 length:336 start_codon:yes stop_codon:yes gene_type:complete
MMEEQTQTVPGSHPQNPMSDSEIEQLSQVYNGLNLFHKAQLLVFLSKDSLLESPVDGSYLPMNQCDVGIRGTAIVLRLPGASDNAAPDEGRVETSGTEQTPEKSADNTHRT